MFKIKGFRKLGDPLFTLPLTRRLGLGDRHVAGGSPWYLSGGVPAANCLAVYIPKGAASLAASYVNQVSPGTYDLVSGVDPSLDADGWVSVAGNSYLISTLTPALTWTVIERHKNCGDAIRALFGCITSATQNFYVRNASGAQSNFQNGNNNVYIAGGYRAAGVYAMAGKTTFIDGVQQTTIAAGGSDPTHVIYFMGLNNGGAVAQRMAANEKMQAAAVYNITLTPTQVAAISAAMANL